MARQGELGKAGRWGKASLAIPRRPFRGNETTQPPPRTPQAPGDKVKVPLPRRGWPRVDRGWWRVAGPAGPGGRGARRWSEVDSICPTSPPRCCTPCPMPAAARCQGVVDYAVSDHGLHRGGGGAGLKAEAGGGHGEAQGPFRGRWGGRGAAEGRGPPRLSLGQGISGAQSSPLAPRHKRHPGLPHPPLDLPVRHMDLPVRHTAGGGTR